MEYTCKNTSCLLPIYQHLVIFTNIAIPTQKRLPNVIINRPVDSIHPGRINQRESRKPTINLSPILVIVDPKGVLALTQGRTFPLNKSLICIRQTFLGSSLINSGWASETFVLELYGAVSAKW